MTRNIYLEDIPLEEALARFWSALDRVGALQLVAAEQVAIDDALGRVTAEPVFATRSVPHYHAAAMDGIAVRADDTLGASETSPIQLKQGEQATWVDTGDAMPAETNAVIMAEHVQDHPIQLRVQAGERTRRQAITRARHQAIVLEQRYHARGTLQDLDGRDHDQLQHRRWIGDGRGDLGRPGLVHSRYAFPVRM